MGSRLSRLAVLVACSTSLMGCILRDFDYQEPVNVPPAVLGTVESPMTEIRIIDLESLVGGDAGAGTTINFTAIVRDANVDQSLVGLVYLDRDVIVPTGQQGLVDDVVIPAEQDNDPWDRRVPFEIQGSDLANAGHGCHSVQLVVTSSTSGVHDVHPSDPTDVGTGVWWIAAIDSSTTAVGMDECPNY